MKIIQDTEIRYIYAIVCHSTGKIYIGQTNNTNSRLKQHISHARQHPKHSFYKDLLKYGFDDFEMVILKDVPIDSNNRQESYDKCNALEKQYIEQYDTIKNGYNVLRGGGYVSTRTEDVKERIRRGVSNYFDVVEEEEFELRNKHLREGQEEYRKRKKSSNN